MVLISGLMIEPGHARGGVQSRAVSDECIRSTYRPDPVSHSVRKAATEPMDDPTDAQDEVRLDVLRRLAEQAMSDPDFRTIARDDLERALIEFGYDLNERELKLVLRFRAALAEAGVDLSLVDVIHDQALAELLHEYR